MTLVLYKGVPTESLKGQGIVGEIAGHAGSIVHTRAKFVQKTNGEQKTMDIFLLYI